MTDVFILRKFLSICIYKKILFNFSVSYDVYTEDFILVIIYPYINIYIYLYFY